MEINYKMKCFEFFLHKTLEWYVETFGNEDHNNISVLKSMKLLFFISAAEVSMDDQREKLVDRMFSNYVAMPFGHVESEIYSELLNRKGDLEYFTIANNTTIRKSSDIQGLIRQIDQNDLNQISNAFTWVKIYHPQLIKYSAFQLVELSHIWYSWRKYYKLATSTGSRSKKIPTEEIKKEVKIFNF